MLKYGYLFLIKPDSVLQFTLLPTTSTILSGEHLK
jgi:hypothetical protein